MNDILETAVLYIYIIALESQKYNALFEKVDYPAYCDLTT